jgi:hypothetical protein
VPFFGQIAGICSLKKPSIGKKTALFSHFADPSQQVYFLSDTSLEGPFDTSFALNFHSKHNSAAALS